MTERVCFVLGLGVLLSGSPARAYRPFDSTDAEVVDPGEVEIELGPVEYVNEDGAELLAAPDLVVNVGVHERLELVAEGRDLAFELAFHYAREDQSDVREVRAGLNWTFDWASAGPP